AIYERFGVPSEIGLAQAILESGLDGRARSRARALGFCQWLSRNWAFLNKLSPAVIEAYNQTTQAPYCAAYLTILATMYDSYIPALSEHNAGGVNVGADGDRARSTSWARTSRRAFATSRSSAIAICSGPTARDPRSMPRWCSATRSTSGGSSPRIHSLESTRCAR